VAEEAADLQGFAEAGAEHIILGCGHPFDLGPVRELRAAAAAIRLPGRQAATA
jgi:hypothetical protein